MLNSECIMLNKDVDELLRILTAICKSSVQNK